MMMTEPGEASDLGSSHAECVGERGVISSPRETNPASLLGGIVLRSSCITVDVLATAGTERADGFVCWGGCGGRGAGKGES